MSHFFIVGIDGRSTGPDRKRWGFAHDAGGSPGVPATHGRSGGYEKPSEHYSDGFSGFLPLAGVRPKPLVLQG